MEMRDRHLRLEGRQTQCEKQDQEQGANSYESPWPDFHALRPQTPARNVTHYSVRGNWSGERSPGCRLQKTKTFEPLIQRPEPDRLRLLGGFGGATPLPSRQPLPIYPLTR
jgi:hypothetical protein